jgi:Fungalysin/Thermolysin Propeptide Motif
VPIARLTAAPLVLVAAIALAIPAGAAAAVPLRTLDTRARDSGPVAPAARRAREQLAQRLGDEGVVRTDRVSGAARLVARTDGFLTGAGGRDPADVALNYVRARPAVFGLDGGDLGSLRVQSRYRSPDGVTHLAYEQTDRGIAAYDNVLYANVDAHGRLLNVGGSAVGGLAVGSAVPAIAAGRALAVAKQEVGGSMLAPRSGPAPSARRASPTATGRG